MAWLGLGALLLFLTAGASAWRSRGVDRISAAALASLLGTLAWSFRVYAAWSVVAIFAGALLAAAILARWSRLASSSRLLLLGVGLLSCLFALFGPADGLF